MVAAQSFKAYVKDSITIAAKGSQERLWQGNRHAMKGVFDFFDQIEIGQPRFNFAYAVNGFECSWTALAFILSADSTSGHFNRDRF